MPALAGQRVRMAEILVQLADRRPIQVVRRVYFVVGFGEAGRLVITRFQNQQWALAESALDRVFAVPSGDDRVLDVASRFVAQGGRWRTSSDLAQHIDDTALGQFVVEPPPGHPIGVAKEAGTRGHRQSAIRSRLRARTR